MYFPPYFGCVLLGVDSLRGGLAEGNGISETDFFEILTIQNDQICYLKHVLAPLYVFFTPFGCCCWGVGSQGIRGTACLCIFPASAAQECLSLSPLRGALPKAIEFSSAPLTQEDLSLKNICGAFRRRGGPAKSPPLLSSSASQ